MIRPASHVKCLGYTLVAGYAFICMCGYNIYIYIYICLWYVYIGYMKYPQSKMVINQLPFHVVWKVGTVPPKLTVNHHFASYSIVMKFNIPHVWTDLVSIIIQFNLHFWTKAYHFISCAISPPKDWKKVCPLFRVHGCSPNSMYSRSGRCSVMGQETINLPWLGMVQMALGETHMKAWHIGYGWKWKTWGTTDLSLFL